jgi:peptide/nickel transport system permease protein
MTYVHFIGKRLVQSIPVVVGVTLVSFLLIHFVPGDPARTLLGPRATPESLAQLNSEYGLDASLVEQYWLYLSHLVTGDLGNSFSYGVPTSELILERLPVTVWLVAYSTVLTCLIAIPLGMLAASGPGRLRDHVVRFLSVAGLGMPSFWLGILLIQYVAIGTGIFPAAGFGEGFTGHLEAMFLPSLTVAISLAPLVIRSLRAEMFDVLDSDYVATARSKGLPEWRIHRSHVLRNALVPSATILAVNVGFFIGATMVVETVFGLPGVGDLMIQAINRRDFAVIQGVTLVLALMVIAVNIIADIAQALLDPRVSAS